MSTPSSTAAASIAHWQFRILSAAQQPLPASIPELFAQMARTYPQQVLLDMFEDAQQITYAEFDALSTRLAIGFRAAGVQAGMHVAVMLPNGLHWHLTWLAVLKLGAAVVPVNPTYTARELEYVLSDARVNALVLGIEREDVTNQLRPWPTTLPRERVWASAAKLGQPCPWQALLDGTAPGREADLIAAELGRETLANIQYTSGTTGFPKGCQLTHGYWLALAQSACLMHPVTTGGQAPLRRFFTAQPFFYMDPFWQLLMTATSGGTLFAAHKISASKFLSWLAELHIEWAQLPELALKSLHTVDGRQLDLRQVFTFGWSAESRLVFEQRFDVPATESFGMTEIGLGLAMPPAYPSATKPVSVGIPALRREARIVDTDGHPVGPDTAGELQIRGEHLFKGYYNKPDANSAAFDGPWFRTGDAFVRDADGFYRIVGRFKDMIRRSSENIAAREIESVVRELDEVFDCAAVAEPDPVRGEEVKIMVQIKTELLRSGQSPKEILQVERLLAHCQRSLAPFKVPRYVQFVNAFPRTASNKVAKHLIARDTHEQVFDRVDGTWLVH